MKYVFILNPISGNKDILFLKEEINKHMENHYYEIWESERPLHAIELAKKAIQENFNTIIVAGGDGSIIEVISGIIGSKVKLGIIPYGTGNMLAANLEIPINNISRAINLIIEGHSKKIDIGKINDKYFAFMSGCGFDAKIIDETSKEKKKKLGMVAYFLEGIRQAFTTNHASFKTKIDNKKMIKTRALTVIVANSANIIGNIFSLAPKACLNDGLLDLIIISPRTRPDYFEVLWQMIVKPSSVNSGKFKHYQAKEIEIKSRPSLLVQADGDIIGKTPVKIKVIPKAIEVITPKQSSHRKTSYFENNHLAKVFNFTLGRFKTNQP